MKIAAHRAGFLLLSLATLVPSSLLAGVSGKISGGGDRSENP